MKGALQVGDLVRHVVLTELGVVTDILPREIRHRRYRVRWLSPQDGMNTSEERACEIEKAGPNL
jgi:hypothetical protein